MKRIRQYFFIILLIIATVILGYNYFFRPFEVKNIPQEEQIAEVTPKIKTQSDIFALLAPEEKIRQMIALPVLVNQGSLVDYDVVNKNLEMNASEEASKSQSMQSLTFQSGFYTLFGTEISMSEASKTVAELKQNVFQELKPWIIVDHEGGRVQRLSGDGFTKLDSWQEICKLDTDEREAALKQSANELKKVGINVVLAPVLDIGSNKVLKDRVCSKDSYPIVADRVMDFTKIFANLRIMPVLKHFPGIGLTSKDLHTSFDYVSVLENDVKLYKYVIEQNEFIGVMTSHVGVISQDKNIPCSVSPYCVSELEKAYPSVLVFTDALEMFSARYDIDNPRVPKDLVEVSKEAILAGNDVLIYGSSVTQEDLNKIIEEMVVEYNANSEFKSKVDQSVLKIIKYKYETN